MTYPKAVEHADDLPRPHWDRLADWLDRHVPAHGTRWPATG
ncbi:hypothetical protein ACERK3_19110 [Phycisphaerales bacterium AB-hyl4]|uniref:Uncharacterized protein n=1 Tax=Natronomicrosphaera hydrolytica TaxID=3242702 RepID=A0ABV4UBU2_9BACT